MKAEMMKDRSSEVSNIMKSIGHPQRLMIMCYLSEGEKNVSDLLELCDISQSQLSQYLNRMHRENLLQVRKEGNFSYYSVADKRVLKLLQSMQKIFCNETTSA